MAEQFDYPDAWRPNSGDVLEGTVTEITEYHGQYEPYPIVTVEQEDGTSLAVHAFHTVLRNALAQLNVQIGEGVAILYGGKQRSKAGDVEYEGYRVKCPGRAPKKFDWNGDGDSTDSGDNDPPPASQDDDVSVPF